MAISLAPGGRQARVAPVEFRDAVELYARGNGVHADVRWVPEPINAWSVEFTLKPGDPRLRSNDPADHKESVLLIEWVDPRREPDHPRRHLLRRHPATNALMPGYVPIELEALGVSGVVEWLERGSVLSGRGEFQDATDAAKQVLQRNAANREADRKQARDNADMRWRENRRAALGIPQIPVGIEFPVTQTKDD